MNSPIIPWLIGGSLLVGYMWLSAPSSPPVPPPIPRIHDPNVNMTTAKANVIKAPSPTLAYIMAQQNAIKNSK